MYNTFKNLLNLFVSHRCQYYGSMKFVLFLIYFIYLSLLRPNSVFYVYIFLKFVLMIVLNCFIMEFFFYNELNYRFSPLDLFFIFYFPLKKIVKSILMV